MSKPLPADTLVDQEADAVLHRLMVAPPPPQLGRVLINAECAREIGTHTRYMRENLDFLKNTTRQLLGAVTDPERDDPGAVLDRLDPLALSFLEKEVRQIVDECSEGLARVEQILDEALEASPPTK